LIEEDYREQKWQIKEWNETQNTNSLRNQSAQSQENGLKRNGGTLKGF